MSSEMKSLNLMKMKLKSEFEGGEYKYLKIELREGLGIVEESSRAKNVGNKGKNSKSNHQDILATTTSNTHCTPKLIISGPDERILWKEGARNWISHYSLLTAIYKDKERKNPRQAKVKSNKDLITRTENSFGISKRLWFSS